MPTGAAAHYVKHHAAALWLIAAACAAPHDRAGTQGDVTRLDSSARRVGVEGAPLDTTSAAAAATRSPKAESATALDHRFQVERSAINAAALGLDSLPPAARRTAAYAARYDSLRRRTLHADSLRRARDRLRATR